MSSIQLALAKPKTLYPLKLILKELITPDTYKFGFELPSANHILGTLSGQHFFIAAKIDDELVYRKYTPTTLEDQKGFFETVIKIYRPNHHPEFPNGGKLTPYLEKLNVGDLVDIEGPIGKCIYRHNGLFNLKHEKDSPFFTKEVKKIGMIAGGSGITPFFQIIRTICSDPNDNTTIKCIFSNHTVEDIILHKELDELEKNNPNKLKMWYTITSSDKPAGWNYSVGKINEEMFREHLPPPGDDTIIFVCGPKGMVWKTAIPTLENMGYSKSMIFKY